MTWPQNHVALELNEYESFLIRDPRAAAAVGCPSRPACTSGWQKLAS